MDVRQYYRKVREVEATIRATFVLVSSLETSDGGKAGTLTEVGREQAAKLIVEGRVVLASQADEKAFIEKRAAEKKAFEKADMARRLQVTIVSAPEEAKTGASDAEPGSRK